MNKRGLSDIVTNVLIILLVLVAVSIIWMFLRPVISDIDELERLELIHGADIKIVSYSIDNSDKNLNLIVKREVGEAKVIAVNIILENNYGESILDRSEGEIQVFETKTIRIDFSSMSGNLTRIAVAPIVLTERERELNGGITDEVLVRGNFEDDLTDPDDGGDDGDGGDGELPECSDGIDNDDDGKIDWGFSSGNDPDCSSPFDDESPNVQIRINWDMFPEFSLPSHFVMIHTGVGYVQGEDLTKPIKHGFTHLRDVATQDRNLLPFEQRLILWTGISAPCRSGSNSYCNPPNTDVCPKFFPSQPWEIRDYNPTCIMLPDSSCTGVSRCSSTFNLFSPFGNELNIYNAHWYSQLRWAVRWWNSGSPITDLSRLRDFVPIILPDIESHKSFPDNPYNDSRILAIKGRPEIPSNLNSLSDEEFVRQYKIEMARMYHQPTKYLRDNGYDGIISGYTDVPIERTWWGIDDFSWNQWTTDWNLVSYVMKDYENPNNFNENFGPLYDEQDWLSPSVYMFYNYSGNIPYALFQIEVNKAWTENEGSDKPILFWYWLNYHDGAPSQFRLRPIDSDVSHALGILPYMSGATGSADWKSSPNAQSVANYHQLIYGLYRLSNYSYMFEGDYETIIPRPAYDSFWAGQNNPNPLPPPIWRGIVNQERNKILVAAYNPYAQPNSVTQINVNYGSFSRTIEVKGKNTFLEVFDL